jgi:chemotaxis protein MotB
VSGDGLPEEHEEHANHEAWVIPYADLLTLLMAMFIALFAMSTVDMTKFKALAIGFNEALNGPNMDTGVFANSPSDSAVEGVGNGSGTGGVGTQANTTRTIENLLEQRSSLEAQRSAEKQSLGGVEKKIADAVKSTGFASKLSLRLEQRGLVVTVVTDKVLFDSGSAALKPEGDQLLGVVADALKTVPNAILIEGHTDSDPIANGVYPSNWELSSGRAGSVARFFEARGLDRTRLRAEGLADLYPVASNDTVEGKAKNRRVEIVVQSKLVDQALEAAGVAEDSAPTTSTTMPVSNAVGDPVDENVSPGLVPNH